MHKSPEPEDHIHKIPTPENSIILQGFEWHCPSDHKHWKRLARHTPALHSIGVTAIWLPPGCKGSDPKSNGYDIYDLYDLGEFDQKGGIPTKWGYKEDLLELSRVAKETGVKLYWDAVLNHKAGADRTEKCRVVEVDEEDRTKDISDAYEIEAWLGFDFPGRGDKYSSQKYHWEHFSGTDFDNVTGKNAIFKILGDNKGWSPFVTDEHGNADYLLFEDLDYAHPEVQQDVKNWGPWITKEVGLSGFRLDAVQHFSSVFISEWIDHLRSECGEDMFIIGEFWNGDVNKMKSFLDDLDQKLCLYDCPLLYNFAEISTSTDADLRKVFDNSLVKDEPTRAVTLVMSHDTQPGQTVETHIEAWFKPLAYSLILLREQGYPCVFWGDLYGTCGPQAEGPACDNKLADIMLARKLYAYGSQDDYWDDPNCIGWVRRGTWDHPAGMAVLMSNEGEAEIRMAVGKMHKGQVWTDLLQWTEGEVVIDDEGYGNFKCPGVSMGIWVRKDAEGRERFPLDDFDNGVYNDCEEMNGNLR